MMGTSPLLLRGFHALILATCDGFLLVLGAYRTYSMTGLLKQVILATGKKCA